MAWKEDYTHPHSWRVDNLVVGNTLTTVDVAARHEPFAGDSIGRDEGRNRASLKLDGGCFRNNGDTRLNFEVEKFDGDGFSCFRLRDSESKKLVRVDGDWLKLGNEEDTPEDDTLLCFTRWDGFQGELAWQLWIKSRDKRIHIDENGWLNSKGYGPQALFTFNKWFHRADLARKEGEGGKEYRARIRKMEVNGGDLPKDWRDDLSRDINQAIAEDDSDDDEE